MEDVLQKLRIKWGVESDENSKFFHILLKTIKRRMMICGFLVDGVWLLDPVVVRHIFFRLLH